MHEEGTLGRGARGDRVTVHLAGEGVAVSTDQGGDARASVAEHREDVVRRLIGRGLSPQALRSLLPEFGTVIDRIDPG